jgi:ribonuclease BN (tRNA processing enzyme)
MTMRHSRRQFLADATSLVLAPAAWAALASGQERKGTRLILLGTRGGPGVGGSRNNPSTLLLINGVPYVVDCGAGTSRQLVAAGVALNRLRYVFFTHLHSDHMLEYGPVVYNGWVTGLRTRVDAYGPPPLKDTTLAFWM